MAWPAQPEDGGTSSGQHLTTWTQVGAGFRAAHPQAGWEAGEGCSPHSRGAFAALVWPGPTALHLPPPSFLLAVLQPSQLPGTHTQSRCKCPGYFAAEEREARRPGKFSTTNSYPRANNIDGGEVYISVDLKRCPSILRC